MGYSERTHLDLEGERRSLTDRIADLGDFTKALGLDETDKPVVTLAHDWGGLVSFGWALEHREILSGVMLTNTAVYHDGIENIPAALRLALGVHEWGTHDSTAFIDVTLGLAQNEGRLPAPGSAGAGALDGALPQPVGQQPKRCLLYTSRTNRHGTHNADAALPNLQESPRISNIRTEIATRVSNQHMVGAGTNNTRRNSPHRHVKNALRGTTRRLPTARTQPQAHRHTRKNTQGIEMHTERAQLQVRNARRGNRSQHVSYRHARQRQHIRH